MGWPDAIAAAAIAFSVFGCMAAMAWCDAKSNCHDDARQERDELIVEVDRLRTDCAQAYQVIGAGMFGEPCEYTQDDVERALDNLAAAANGDPRPHDDLLPWPKEVA